MIRTRQNKAAVERIAKLEYLNCCPAYKMLKMRSTEKRRIGRESHKHSVWGKKHALWEEDGKMALLAKSLLYKYEDVSLSPRIHRKKANVVSYTHNPGSGRWTHQELWGPVVS